MAEEETPSYSFGTIPSGIKEMKGILDDEMEEEAKKQIEDLQAKNDIAKDIIKKLTRKITAEVEGINWVMRPISVAVWDEVEGAEDDIKKQSYVVRKSLEYPEFNETQFGLIDAGIKYKLYMILLQDFFLMAGKIKRIAS